MAASESVGTVSLSRSSQSPLMERAPADGPFKDQAQSSHCHLLLVLAGLGKGGRCRTSCLWKGRALAVWGDDSSWSLSHLPLSLPTDLTVVIAAVVGGGVSLLFVLGLIICCAKKK